MKIVYMGTPDFAVNPLHALAEAGYEVTGVVTQPDKAKGRGKKVIYSEHASHSCKGRGIETWVPGLPACEGTRSGIFTGS